MSLENFLRLTATLAAALLIASTLGTGAQSSGSPKIAIDKDDIAGIVTSSKGPEAGVWVIAETADLPTKFAKIVVTDDQGRYLLPDLPVANYQVWVRGYGLVDSPKQPAKPGQHLDLKADVAPDAKTAAQVYPAAWWAAMMKFPADPSLQRKIALDFKECYDCHQLGNNITRHIQPTTVPGATSTLDAWDRRTKVGPSGPAMGTSFQGFGPQRQMFADWVDAIAKNGDAPTQPPPRPAGVERNLVISEWDWGKPNNGRTDAAASDTRNPRVNGNGLVFEASEMTDSLDILDPVQNKSMVLKVNNEAPKLVSAFNASPTPSPYGGSDVWQRAADPRSVAIDSKGRVWVAARNRGNQSQPAFCTSGKYGSFYPLRQSARQLALYDPKTKEWQHIDTCFSADHNEIGEDNVIYFGIGSGIGWVDINVWDKTHDPEAAQGWCPGVLDTNRDGKITPGWTEPNEPIDPKRDHRIQFGAYSTTINHKDGSLWVSGIGRGDKRLVRIVRGSNPPETCHTEFFEPPTNQAIEIFGSGGVEADQNGVVWQNWRVSGHFTGFDRTKCKTTDDPGATGQSCPEGWAVYRYDKVPSYDGTVFNPAASYLTHMDKWDVLGLGRGLPMYGTTNLDALVAYDARASQFITLRIPYPMGYMARAANGRIDDPRGGWKGKGLWSDYGSYAGWHREGGWGTLPKAVKFQMRPNPLAK